MMSSPYRSQLHRCERSEAELPLRVLQRPQWELHNPVVVSYKRKPQLSIHTTLTGGRVPLLGGIARWDVVRTEVSDQIIAYKFA